MADKETVVVLNTTFGDIKIALSNKTPGHRDNFLKNVEEKAYDGVLFHRVIKEFMIQTGDPASKTAKKGQMLGASDHGSEIPAEFVSELFHKKGAIAAARTADSVNPEKKSSGSQFYIVTGKVYKDQELTQMEKQLQQRQEQEVFQSLVEKNKKEVMDLRRARNQEGLYQLQERLIKETKDILEDGAFKFSAEQREAYTSVGGTPFLDGGYTVYGQVVEGMDVIEKIEKVATDGNDRPKDDVKIIKATVED